MARRTINKDQRTLIPALLLDTPYQPPMPARWTVTFTYEGITHIRSCPTQVYYETMLMLTRRYLTDAHGSLDPPPASAYPDGYATRRSAQ